MSRPKRLIELGIASLLVTVAFAWAQEPHERLQVAEGYQLSVFASDIRGARMLRVTPEGDLIVALTRRGEVWWLARDADGDGRSDGRRQLFSNLDRPNGLEIRNGLLYVAENTRVITIPFNSESATLRGRPNTLIGGLPRGGNHFRKVIRFGDPDPDLGRGRDDLINTSIHPEHGFRAHNAPLGIEFLEFEGHPHDYQGAAIVALHGSWNRSEKDGYKAVSLHWVRDWATGEETINERDFMWGFLDKGHVIGRPAEEAEDAEGNIYISDDYAQAVYKVSPRRAG